MGWRYVCISEAIRINYRLNSIGVSYKDEIIWMNLDEIDTIIIEDLRCNTSIRLLVELAQKGISVILCSQNHTPQSLLLPLQNNSRTAKYNQFQLEWNKKIKRKVWTEIVKYKIYLQYQVLKMCEKHDKLDMLLNYISEVSEGDITNREGHAAKVYFRELFGSDFTRERNQNDIINSSLNYIYQIVRSKIAQEIVGHGYLPSVGIFHCSEYNYFALADDIIEVFRPFCDYFVINLLKKDEITFMTPSYKEKLISILLETVIIKDTKQKFSEAIRLFVYSFTDALTNNNLDLIRFPSFDKYE